MKIPKKHENKIVMIFMVSIMTIVLSFAITVKNNGFNSQFIGLWIKSWAFSFTVALPLVLLIMPIIKKTVAKFVE